MIVSHKFKDAGDRKIGMLLPLGEWTHQSILSLNLGDIISDPDGNEARILKMKEIDAHSDFADIVSINLYGRPIETILRIMYDKWDTDGDKLLYLVVEKINK